MGLRRRPRELRVRQIFLMQGLHSLYLEKHCFKGDREPRAMRLTFSQVINLHRLEAGLP